jgi:translocator protein
MSAPTLPRFDLSAILRLIVSIAIAQSAGLIGTLVTDTGEGTWYAQLDKPWFTPPGWVFGPVWTTLYVMMGIAAFLVWERRQEHSGALVALAVYAVQLVLNLSWSLVFFGLESPGGGLVVIVAMLAAIVATMILFWPISRAASLLLVPYLLWVCFATVLNASIWAMN